MRAAIRAGLAAPLLIWTACASAGGSPSPAQDADARPTTSLAYAQPGDTVYLIRHYVRPERQDHFEDFMRTVLLPAFRQAADASWSRVRLLQPVRPETDGTLSYTFVLDPYVSGESYDVFALLSRVHGEEEALRQYTRFTEMWARDFTAHAFVQSR